MTVLKALVLAAAVAAPSMALAADDPVSGIWTIHGKIENKAFTLTCQFDRHGDGIGGSCLDQGTGIRHAIDTGHIDGDRVSWSFPSSFMLMKFESSYDGHLAGGQLHGTTKAAGHSGVFSGVRP